MGVLTESVLTMRGRRAATSKLHTRQTHTNPEGLKRQLLSGKSKWGLSKWGLTIALTTHTPLIKGVHFHPLH